MPTQLPLTASRLQSLLTECLQASAESVAADIAPRLGAMIDFNSSIKLSESVGGLSRLRGGGDSPAASAQELVLTARAGVLRLIASSFDAQATAQRIPLPRPDAESLVSAEKAFAPYGKFYGSMQAELAHCSYRVRERVRTALAKGPTRLAQLVALDRALDESLAVEYRARLARIPTLLAHYFYQQVTPYLQTKDAGASAQAFADWARDAGPREQFCHTMRAVLLAELELRLEPVMGLLAAIDEEVGTPP